MSEWRLRLLIGFGLTLPLTVQAEAGECDERAAKMAAERGMTLERKSPGGDWVHFTHPNAPNLSMRCRTKPDARRSVHLRWDGATPPAQFFSLAGRAAEIAFDASPGDVRLLSMRCLQQAAADASRQALIKHRGVEVDCIAGVDEPGQVSVTIWEQ